MKKIYRWILCMVVPCTILTSCFDLEEQVYSEVIQEGFVPTEQDINSLVGSVYLPFKDFVLNWQGYFDLQEEPGDCIITPTRPNGWDDGGTYRRMHQHEWTSQQWQPTNAYNQCFKGINNSNRVMDKIKSGEYPIADAVKKESILNELRAARALWYSILLDTHGRVPLVTSFSEEIPTQATRQQVYDFVVSELTEVVSKLSPETGMSTYGRMNRWAAYMVLARVYLNAEVYTGTAQWEKALVCADSIIGSGKYQLSADFSDNFKMDVDYTNKEIIFAVPYDRTYGSFAQFAKWYPPISRLAFGANYQCWGGSCANPQFINAYQPGDKRLEKTWLMGPQYRFDDPTKTQLVWTCKNELPSLTCTKDGTSYTSIDWGYRVFKWEFDNITSWGWGNDFSFYRYAEVMMIKAECLLRLGRDEGVALQLVNEVRARVFDAGDPRATLTLADLKGDTKIQYGTLDWDGNIDNAGDQTPVELGGLYDEYGWEFACEAQRRTHMIRFGTFQTKNWFNHVAKPDGHTRIFPIPLAEIQKNANLTQNPGYN